MIIDDNSDNLINQENEETHLRDIVFRYLSHWKWIFSSVLIFTLLAYIYIKLGTPLYKIETDLLIKDNKQNMTGQNDLLKDLDLFSSDKIIDNEIQILKSKTIMEKVVKGLKLQTNYFNTDGVRKHEVYGNLPFRVDLIKATGTDNNLLAIRLLDTNDAEVNGKKYNIKYPIKTEDGFIKITPDSLWNNSMKSTLDVKFNDVDNVIELYSANLKIEPVSKQATALIITLEDALPQRGKDVLNNVVLEYNKAAVEDKNKVTSNTLKFINDRIEVLAAELNTVEKNVEQYKSTNQITNVSAESEAFIKNISENDADLSKVLIKLSVLNNLEDYLKKTGDHPATLPSMFAIDDPTLLGLVSQLGEIELKRQSLLQTAPETNPLVSSLTDQINALKQAIGPSVQNLKNGLLVTKQQLQNKSNEFEAVVKKVPTVERGLLDVMRQQEIKNNLFTYLLQKREETAMQLASGVADSRTIDMAWSSRNPVKPVKRIVYAIFILVGFLLPSVIIYLINLLNFKITRRQDIEKFTKAPILAEISQSEESNALIVTTKPRSMVAEQIRAMRTNLQFIISEENAKVLLFTSSISGEGKSFISLNLGASLAMSGKKVVILELDLRKPKLHTGLDINNDLGLSNYLIGRATYHNILKEIPMQKDYYIITSGPIPPNPAELLANGKIEELLTQLKTEFDYIILDAPPVGLVTDAQILGIYSDATMFIVRHNYTAKNQVRNINNYYMSKKFKNLNIVINGIYLQKGYSYSYGYGYGYGYDGGYYSEEKPNDSKALSKWFKK